MVLLIERDRQRREVTIRRVLPVGRPVTAERVDDVLIIRIPSFSAQTERQVAAALLGAFSQGAPKAVLLDLRGNRGGLLSQAAAVADVFLGRGEAFRTLGRHPEASRIYITAGGDLAQGVPLVVLVDGRTASSAEIVAATLSDRGRAAMLGTSTTGKGLVQLVVPLPDGGELLMSWSRLIMPAGWPLQGVGVLPGLCADGGPVRAGRDPGKAAQRRPADGRGTVAPARPAPPREPRGGRGPARRLPAGRGAGRGHRRGAGAGARPGRHGGGDAAIGIARRCRAGRPVRAGESERRPSMRGARRARYRPGRR